VRKVKALKMLRIAEFDLRAWDIRITEKALIAGKVEIQEGYLPPSRVVIVSGLVPHIPPEFGGCGGNVGD